MDDRLKNIPIVFIEDGIKKTETKTLESLRR